MVHFMSLVALGLAATAVQAAPVKRATQIISESTQPWVQACQAARGGARCGEISVKAFSTLLAAPGACEQQNAADEMIDLAKQLNSTEMISLAQIFRQQPRNSPNRNLVPYCQTAPRNQELAGLFQCQFADVKFDNSSTPPGGAAVNPPGSCPANRAGPIPDGTQLHTLTTNPGVGGGNGGGNAPAPAPAPVSSATRAPVSSAAPAPVSSSTPTPPSGTCGGTVLVKSGDTCNSIAQANNIQVSDIMSRNPSINARCSNLTVGQQLCLP